MVDTEHPNILGLKGNLHTMPSKTYTQEFKRDAVTLYENSPGASIQTIATDLGINRATLANWVKKYGTGARTNSLMAEKSSSTSVNEAE